MNGRSKTRGRRGENTGIDASGDIDLDVPVVSDDGTITCPNCGKEVDADMEFCHWCTTEFATLNSDSN